MTPTSKRMRARPRHRARRPSRTVLGGVTLVGAVAVVVSGVALVMPNGASGWATRAGDDGTIVADPRLDSAANVVLVRPAQRVRAGTELRKESVVPIPLTGSGRFDSAASRTMSEVSVDLLYSVEVEDSLPISPRDFATEVDGTLSDPRSWAGRLGMTLRRVGSEPSLRILLATPGTTDRLCAPLQTAGQVSCRNGSLVVLNAVRWVEAVPWFAGDVSLYRTYLVNHEVGHALGRGHENCPGPGLPAPVMQQQTYGLQGCLAAAWPSPVDLG